MQQQQECAKGIHGERKEIIVSKSWVIWGKLLNTCVKEGVWKINTETKRLYNIL